MQQLSMLSSGIDPDIRDHDRLRNEFLQTLASSGVSNQTNGSSGSGSQIAQLSGNNSAGPVSWWVTSLHWAQGSLATLGMVGNCLVILTLIRRRYKSQFASAVFLHQTLMDFMVCVFTLVLLVKPSQNPTSSVDIGFALCHVINSQLLYWYFVFSSVQNLVLIAIDRYFAVFRPVKYKTLSYRSAAIHLVCLHCYSLAVNIIDIFSVEFDRDSNQCSTEITNHVFKKVFKVYGFLWFILVYLLPVAAVVCLYSIIIYRLSNQGLQNSRFRQRAATELTKSAVIITVIFIVCFSYDCIYYLLGHLDLVQYVYNSPTQLIGVALVTINSCANPVVYCIIMPSFRERMLAAVCSYCCCRRPGRQHRRPSVASCFRCCAAAGPDASTTAAADAEDDDNEEALENCECGDDRRCQQADKDMENWDCHNGTALVTITVSARSALYSTDEIAS